MELACSKGSDQYERLPSLLGFPYAKSDKHNEYFKSDKMLHDGQFYGYTGYPKFVSTLSHNSLKLLVSTRYTTENSHGLHDIKVNILKLAYHHPRRFSGLLGLEGEFQGLGLWYIVKESRFLLLNRQNDKKISWISASFSANHSILSATFLLNRSNCTKRIGKL